MDIKTKEEYLMILGEELRYLKREDAQKVIEYYYNMITSSIDYGEKEEDVLARLPEPKDIAKEQYESRGIKYLEIRKRKETFKSIISIILFSLLLLIITIASIFIIYILGVNFIKCIKLSILILSSNQAYNIISFLMVLCYSILVLGILYYLIDLILIIFTSILKNLFVKINYLKPSFNKEIDTLSLSVILDNKIKVKKLPLKILIGSLMFMILLGIVSYGNKGYLYMAINDITTMKETIVLEDTNDINIDVKVANVYFYHTEEASYLEYEYCFNHDKVITSSSTLDIKLSNSDTYDIFNLLKEPTQNIKIYLSKEIDNVDIKTSGGEIVFYAGNFDHVKINADSNITVITSSVDIDDLDIEGSIVYLGYKSSNIKNSKLKSVNGQVVSEKANIDDLIIDGGISKIKLTDSLIKNTDITLTGGLIEISGQVGDSLKINTKANQTKIKDSIFNKGNINLGTTAYFNGDLVIFNDNITIEATSSYVLFDMIKTPLINVNSKDTYLFLSGVGKDSGEGYLNYTDDIHYDTSLISIISGTSSKTEIGESIFDKVDITQIKGYLLISDTKLGSGNITTNSTKGVEYNNTSCDLIKLYIDMIDGKYNFTSDVNQEGTYEVHKCDTLSYTYIKYDETYNVILKLDDVE